MKQENPSKAFPTPQVSLGPSHLVGKQACQRNRPNCMPFRSFLCTNPTPQTLFGMYIYIYTHKYTYIYIYIYLHILLFSQICFYVYTHTPSSRVFPHNPQKTISHQSPRVLGECLSQDDLDGEGRLQSSGQLKNCLQVRAHDAGGSLPAEVLCRA